MSAVQLAQFEQAALLELNQLMRLLAHDWRDLRSLQQWRIAFTGGARPITPIPYFSLRSYNSSIVIHNKVWRTHSDFLLSQCVVKSCEYGEQSNLMGLGDLWSVDFHTHKTFPLSIIQNFILVIIRDHETHFSRSER